MWKRSGDDFIIISLDVSEGDPTLVQNWKVVEERAANKLIMKTKNFSHLSI